MTTQYVAVKFSPESSRTYTYLNKGDPVAPGDLVQIGTQEKPKTVTVDSVTDEAPPFACKPILGKVEPEGAIDE